MIPSIHWLAFVNYFLACYSSMIANGLVIFLSLKMSKNGDFKWVYLGFAVTEFLLSFSAIMISMNIYVTDNGDTIVYSDNLLIDLLGPGFCSFVYKIIYHWQISCFFFSISLISFSRYIIICRQKLKNSEKLWIVLVVVIQLVSFILVVILPFASSGFTLIGSSSQFNETVIINSISNRIFCTTVLASSSMIIGPALGLVGMFSYIVTIFCVSRLVVNLRKSFRAVSSVADLNTAKKTEISINFRGYSIVFALNLCFARRYHFCAS